jgi:copper ion binding protein
MTTTTVLNVNGMKCMHCKKRVEDACKGVNGVKDAKVNLDAKNVTVTLENNVDASLIKKAINDAGYEAK